MVEKCAGVCVREGLTLIFVGQSMQYFLYVRCGGNVHGTPEIVDGEIAGSGVSRSPRCVVVTEI